MPAIENLTNLLYLLLCEGIKILQSKGVDSKIRNIKELIKNLDFLKIQIYIVLRG